MAKNNFDEIKDKVESNFGGIFSGLTSLLEKLGEVSENAEENKGKEFSTTINGKELKGVYGFSFKTGIGNRGEKEIKVEPFGNVKNDKKTGNATVEEIREPLVDLIEEDDHLQILVEMPGVSASDVKLELEGDILNISANNGDRKYHKEILLPYSLKKSELKLTGNNGIFEIKGVKDE